MQGVIWQDSFKREE